MISIRSISAAAAASHLIYLYSIFFLQDAKRTEVDLRAPVHKQRAKRFNLDEELQKLKAAQDYTNKKIERPKEWWEAGTPKQ